MKKGYEKPVLEFEEYELNTAIASGCGTIVSLGPGGDGIHSMCSEYEDAFDMEAALLSVEPTKTNFYEGSCSCYLSAGDGTLFTS